MEIKTQIVKKNSNFRGTVQNKWDYSVTALYYPVKIRVLFIVYAFGFDFNTLAAIHVSDLC